MKIRRIHLPKDAVAKMTAPDRNFLLLAGHMLNEINSVNKVFASCLHNGGPWSASSIGSLANGAQAMIYARVLTGKLCEAWEAVEKAWFGTKLSQRLEPKLHPDAHEANTKLKAYFSRSNTIYRGRNSFAFHYSATEVGVSWESVADDLTFEVILGRTVGNNLCLGTELAANAALLKAMDPTNPDRACTSSSTKYNRQQRTSQTFSKVQSLSFSKICSVQIFDSLDAKKISSLLSPIPRSKSLTSAYRTLANDGV